MAPLRSLGNIRSAFDDFYARTGTDAAGPNAVSPMVASGGTKISTSNHFIHVFTASSSPGFDITSLGPGTVEVLVVAGGGGSGGGGGGAGGLVNSPYTFATTGPNAIVIGAGGNGGNDGPTVQMGSNGGESYIGPSGAKIKPASGGGAGGITDAPPASGNPGGSGGGQAAQTPASGGTGVSGQGNPGGTAYAYGAGNANAAGGGGAGAAGTPGSNPSDSPPRSGGPGGVGAAIPWMPSDYGTTGPSPGRWFAGGGGGGCWGTNPGQGGAGGGGNGGNPSSVNANAGTINTGGGAGGVSYPPWGSAASGGSGIVAIRYAK